MAVVGKPIFIVLSLLSCMVAPAAYAEVHRCLAPDGTTVFTDRRCADVGGVEQTTAPPPTSAASVYRSGCSHALQDLVLELTTAIDSQDVNRLAGVYDWDGMSTGNAYALMDRLQILAERPLADVAPVYAGGDSGMDDYYPQTSVHRVPIGLRLEQTLRNGATPAPTVMYLRRYLGCWWVRL
jgi:hypothetical protein